MSSHAPHQGDTIAAYRLIEPIGEGGMGVVWRAEHTTLGRRAAVKIIRPELARSPEFRRRFTEEARAAAIDHPNVVTVFDGGEADGVLYLAMALVEGGTLRDDLDRGGPLPPPRAVDVIAQVGAGLDAAHAAGLVHRDVKPANVLLDPGSGRARITDFGVAKAGDATGITRTGVMVGTLDYVAPEQVEGRPVDPRTDVYALGCMLYETLTGQVPFAHDQPAARLWAHLHEPPPRPSERGAPPALDGVVACAMAKAQADRFASAGALGRAAQAALHGVPSAPVTAAPGPTAPARPPAPAPTALDTRTPPPPPPHLPPGPPPGRRHTGLLVAVSIVALLALGVAAAFALTRGTADPSPTVAAVTAPGTATAITTTTATTTKTTTTTTTTGGTGSTRTFHAPSGNVSCEIGPRQAVCSVASVDTTWTVGDSGSGFSRAGTQLPRGSGDGVTWGQVVSVGAFTCTIPLETQRRGIRCVNDDTGHGFEASRSAARQKTF